MLVNEMIKQLEEIQEEHGDIDVKVWSSEFEEDNSIDVMGTIVINGEKFVRILGEN